MKPCMAKWVFCVVFSGVLIIACAGTKLTHTWVDETYHTRPVSDILVIAVTHKEDNRQSFEDKFVAQLKVSGVAAVSSSDVISIPSDLELKKEEISSAVNKFKNDAVIITHMVGVEEKESYTPPERNRGGYYGYYGWAYGYTHEPGYYRTRTLVRLTTHLYDVKTEKLIWSGESETLDPGSINQIIDDVIEVLIKDLQKNRLLPIK
ncbi:MAG: hypothetical protein JRE28_12555 [Deltaproteobacteria bacterium]|nr:hypothetical protein [Deltaproteobacteria bacterium]